MGRLRAIMLGALAIMFPTLEVQEMLKATRTQLLRVQGVEFPKEHASCR